MLTPHPSLPAWQEHYESILQEATLQQVIEMDIPRAGGTVSFDTDTLTSMQETLGIALINPNPKSAGHGTLRLRIGDKEILPEGFHADMIAKFNPREVDAKTTFAFKEYVFPVKTEAKGKPLKIEYAEPNDGGKGKLYLYLLGSKDTNNRSIPKFRFQVLGFTLPKGNSNKDIEIGIDEKTLQSHSKVIGTVFLGQSNRIKQVKLSIDETTVFPEGMPGQLAVKEIVNAKTTSNGIFTKHTIPFTYLLYACDLKANSSKIEGKILATPSPDGDYKVFLYLLTAIDQ